MNPKQNELEKEIKKIFVIGVSSDTMKAQVVELVKRQRLALLEELEQEVGEDATVSYDDAPSTPEVQAERDVIISYVKGENIERQRIRQIINKKKESL